MCNMRYVGTFKQFISSGIHYLDIVGAKTASCSNVHGHLLLMQVIHIQNYSVQVIGKPCQI